MWLTWIPRGVASLQGKHGRSFACTRCIIPYEVRAHARLAGVSAVVVPLLYCAGALEIQRKCELESASSLCIRMACPLAHTRTHKHGSQLSRLCSFVPWLPQRQKLTRCDTGTHAGINTKENRKTDIWGFHGPAWLWLGGKQSRAQSQLHATCER